MKGRITRVEHERRVAQVLRLILSGLRPSEIYRVAAQEWNVSARTAERYLAAARTDVQQVMAQHTTELLAEHVAHRRDMRRRARTAGDRRMELAVAQDEARLLQLYPAERQERITVHPEEWTDAQLDAYRVGVPLERVLAMEPKTITAGPPAPKKAPVSLLSAHETAAVVGSASA